MWSNVKSMAFRVVSFDFYEVFEFFMLVFYYSRPRKLFFIFFYFFFSFYFLFMSDVILHEHDIFSQSCNSFGSFTWEVEVSGDHCKNQDVMYLRAPVRILQYLNYFPHSHSLCILCLNNCCYREKPRHQTYCWCLCWTILLNFISK